MRDDLICQTAMYGLIRGESEGESQEEDGTLPLFVRDLLDAYDSCRQPGSSIFVN